MDDELAKTYVTCFHSPFAFSKHDYVGFPSRTFASFALKELS